MAEERFLEYKPILDEVRSRAVSNSPQIEEIQREAGLDADEISNVRRDRPGASAESRHRR